MEIVSWPEASTPATLRRQVVRLQQLAWPDDPPPDPLAPTHDPALAPVSVLLVSDGEVVAALDLLRKRLDHAGRTYAAVGLSTVVTDPDRRRRGAGRRLVATVREQLADGPDDLALFTCDRVLQGFYEQAGWTVLPGAVVVGGTEQEPFPSDQPGFDKVTFAEFLSPRARARAATFAHSRIELHPGELDKLW